MKAPYWLLGVLLLLSSCAQGGPSTTTAPGRASNLSTATTGPGMRSSGLWIDKLTEYVLMQKAVAKEGNYEPYLADLRKAKAARERGDWIGQYDTMNRFIDRLDAREGGISAKSAQDIREYTYLVEPAGLHNLAKDVQSHPEVMKWQDRRARAREEAERSF